MKILQISSEGNFGSIGTIAEQIGISLIENGNKSYIAIGDYYLPSSSKTYKIGNFITRYLHAIETRFFDRNGLGSRFSTIKLIRWIKKTSPDLIHVHQFHGYYLNYNIFTKFLIEYNIPVVFTLHDCWTFTGHCAYFERINCDKWKTKCNQCELLSDYPKSYFHDNSSSNFLLKKTLFNKLSNLHLVTVSKWLASKVENSFLKNIPKSVIYNGINLDVFKPNLDLNFLKNSYNNKFIILGVASPWNTRKGLNDFVKLSNYLNDDEIIMLIGLSDSQISTLPNNIIGIPKIIDKQTLSKYYSRANIFLNLSIEETFGLTTVEAMACGTPVIVYNSTACPEIVSDATGFIVEKHDIVSIRDIIRDFKQNENMRNSMSINCRKHVFDKFNSVDRYLEYVTLYTKILN